jgi:CO/xanthine dehydrogenase FAD-binding subunit
MTMGTVGGNICNASPAADTVPSLIAFGAQVKLVSSSGERVIDLEDFLVGPGQSALAEGEVLHSVLLPAVADQTGSAFIKVGRVVADISQVSVAVKIVRDGDKVADCRIALGSVGPTTVRARGAEQHLIGKTLDLATLEEAVRILEKEIKPITDVRTTEDYRRQVAGGITAEALKKSWERTQGGAIQ